jgi:hypothetical protein
MAPNEEVRKQAAFHRLGTSEPRCAICTVSDWHCLDIYPTVQVGKTERSAILCANCQLKLSIDPNAEGLRATAFRRLGTPTPQCVVCTEPDWRCLELHHTAGQGYADDTVVLCRNCHLRQSNPSNNAPSPNNPPLMEQIGSWLIGLGKLLVELGQRAISHGEQLLRGAQICPRPWGWLPPQPGIA